MGYLRDNFWLSAMEKAQARCRLGNDVHENAPK
jgi:hypothetical protein